MKRLVRYIASLCNGSSTTGAIERPRLFLLCEIHFQYYARAFSFAVSPGAQSNLRFRSYAPRPSSRCPFAFCATESSSSLLNFHTFARFITPVKPDAILRHSFDDYKFRNHYDKMYGQKIGRQMNYFTCVRTLD